MAISLNWLTTARADVGGTFSMSYVFGAMETLAFAMTPMAQSSLLAGYEGTYQGHSYLASVNGGPFSYGYPSPVITAGDIGGVSFANGSFSGGPVTSTFVITETLLPANELDPLAVVGAIPASAAALDAIFLGYDWIYQGSLGRDILTWRSTTPAGTRINLAGNDTVNLSDGNDKFFSGDGNDFVSGDSGRDKLWGGKGQDTLFGVDGNDTLVGGKGHDALWGGKGDDRLIGGKGHDMLKGQAGADTFVFDGAINESRDRIVHFQNGTDVIEVQNATMANVHITSVDAGISTLITLDSGTEIYLHGVNASLVDSGDFLFV